MTRSNRQKKALKIVSYFIPRWVTDWSSSISVINDGFIGIDLVKESPTGFSPEDAFFLKTEHGKIPDNVTDKSQLRSLLWGQRWVSTQEKIWKKNKNAFFPEDFSNTDPEIKEFIFKIFGWIKN
jgi:hypothetical protein